MKRIFIFSLFIVIANICISQIHILSLISNNSEIIRNDTNSIIVKEDKGRNTPEYYKYKREKEKNSFDYFIYNDLAIYTQKNFYNSTESFQDEYFSAIKKIEKNNLDATKFEKLVETEKYKLDSNLESMGKWDILREKYTYYYKLNKINTLKFNSISIPVKIKLFFIWNPTEAELFYDNTIDNKKIKLLKNTSFFILPGNNPNVLLYNELIYDYFGPFRASISSQISNSNSNNTDSTNSNKANLDAKMSMIGGGNLMVNLYYPYLFWHSNKNKIQFISSISAKCAFDFPKIGTTLNDPLMKINGGIDYSLFNRGAKDNISFFINGNSSYIYANNKDFYEKLNYNKDKKIFLFHTFTIGLALKSTYRLAINFYESNGFLETKLPITLSFAIIP